MKTFSIHITGLVQGVGFRPFVYLLAGSCGLKGTVENTTAGVVIRVTGNPKTVREFCDAIRRKAPLASHIDSLVITETGYREWKDFSIVKSSVISEEITEVSPDIAVCRECLADLEKQPR
ncbi:MAG TPA: acylphosphatase, partial [Bacteroidales bacterium]|nr:acylphosphatase [Bacteroidales bacterium]